MSADTMTPPEAVRPVGRVTGARRSAPVMTSLGLIVLVLSVPLCARVGGNGVGFAELGRVVGARLGVGVEPLPRLLDSLIWDLRLPRVLMAVFVGAGLAVCGATLQSVTRNALADPYLLGVSHGASTGAVLVVVLGIGGSLGVAGGAFVGALTSFALLLALSRRAGTTAVRIVLTGVVVGQLFAALTSLVVMASADAEATRAITYWLLGSLSAARWDALLVCAAVTVLGCVLLRGLAGRLDAFAFGEDTAASLGVNVRRTRMTLLVITALLTAVAVASVGAVGFVGLIVPHGVRLLIGPTHRALLPLTAVVGAVFLMWTDAVARIAFAPRDVPVGVFTALVGVPLFLLVLRRRGAW